MTLSDSRKVVKRVLSRVQKPLSLKCRAKDVTPIGWHRLSIDRMMQHAQLEAHKRKAPVVLSYRRSELDVQVSDAGEVVQIGQESSG